RRVCESARSPRRLAVPISHRIEESPMHDDRRLTADRLARLLRERIRPATYRTVAPLTVTAWHVNGGHGEPVPPAVALPRAGADGPDPRYVPLQVGQE